MGDIKQLTRQRLEQVAQNTIAYIQKQVGNDLLVLGLVLSQLQSYRYVGQELVYFEGLADGGRKFDIPNSDEELSGAEGENDKAAHRLKRINEIFATTKTGNQKVARFKNLMRKQNLSENNILELKALSYELKITP